jgi:transketolase
VKKLREEFADTVLDLGPKDSRMVVLVGDISHGILKPFAESCPGRYYNIGICEPAMVNMAAGLSKVGLIPIIHTIAPFLIERSYEQIKLDFGYQELGVNLISVGGSFDYAQLGCSHHCYSDVSLISHFNRGVVVMPGSPIEFNKLFTDIYANQKINYFRLSEQSHGVAFSAKDINFGKGIKIRDGQDLTIAVVGSQLKNAIAAAELLAVDGVSVEILYFHTLKPFDKDILRASLVKTRRLISLEELSAHDGLFNLCLRSAIGIDGLRTEQLAVQDFIHGYGSYENLCDKAGLNAQGVYAAAKRIIN